MSEGEFVKEARLAAGLSQTKLAKRLGWSSPQFVSNIERGLSSLPNSSVNDFVRATKCSKKAFIRVKSKSLVEQFLKEVGFTI